MACGRPVVAALTGGMGWLIGYPGCIPLPSRNAGQVKRAIAEVLEHGDAFAAAVHAWTTRFGISRVPFGVERIAGTREGYVLAFTGFTRERKSCIVLAIGIAMLRRVRSWRSPAVRTAVGLVAGTVVAVPGYAQHRTGVAVAIAGDTAVVGAPIVAERAMWWGPTSESWYEGHASLGAVGPAPTWAIGEAASGRADLEDTYLLLANTSEDGGDLQLTLVFDDGTTTQKSFTLAGEARLTLRISDHFPEADDRRFSVLVESLDFDVRMIVECARYQSTSGRFGNAGGVALATFIPQ